MTDARQVLAAAFLSLALHAGVGAALRGVRLEGPPVPRDASLFVDLVEPVVAMPAAEPPPPRRRVASRPRSAVPPAPVPVETRSAIATALVPAPPSAVPVPPGPPPPPGAAVAPPRTPPAPLPLPPVPAGPHAGVRRGASAAPEGLAAAPPAGEPPPPSSAAPATTARGDAATGAGAGGARDAVEAASRGAGAPPAAVSDTPPPGGRVDRAPGPVVARATPGWGGTLPPEYEPYVRAFRQRIQERLRYPALAVRQGLAGMVELEVKLDAAGRLTGVTVVEREAAALLRDAAVQAVRDATPFPLPPNVRARALTIRLPVVFELR